MLAEAQLRTAETFGFDYVSAISDPAREASDLGAAIEWFDDQPPAIVESQALLAEKTAPGRPAHARSGDARRACATAWKPSACCAEGPGRNCWWRAGWKGPCAMSADLRGVNTLMLDFFDDPAFVRDLFEFTVEMELRFARAQIEAGADIIGVGDAAASLIGPKLYFEFVQPYEQRLVRAIQDAGAPRAPAHLRQDAQAV